MDKVVLIGCGGHAKSVVDALELQSKYEVVGFTEVPEQSHFTYRGYQVLGGDDILPSLFAHGIHYAFVCVGYIGKGTLRQQLYTQVKNIGFSLATVIDPTAILARDVQIGEGTFVGKRAVVNSAVQIGIMSIINSGSIVEHDCRVGSFSHIACGAVLCGGVILGKHSMVGANATIVQGLTLPDHSFIKSGSLWRGGV